MKAAEVSNVREVRRQGGLAYQEEARPGLHRSTALGILTELQPLKGAVLLLQPLIHLQNLFVHRKRPFLFLLFWGQGSFVWRSVLVSLIWSKSQKVMVTILDLEVQDQVAGKVGSLWDPRECLLSSLPWLLWVC